MINIPLSTIPQPNLNEKRETLDPYLVERDKRIIVRDLLVRKQGRENGVTPIT